MRYFLLSLLGTALAMSTTLQADSLTVSAGLVGGQYPFCENTSMHCLAGDKNGAYAENTYSRHVSGNTISYGTTMDIMGGPGIEFGQTDIVGTIVLPSSWTSVDITTAGDGLNVSPDFVLLASFDHQQPLHFNTTVHYTLDPSIPNLLNVVEDVEGGAPPPCNQNFCSTNYFSTFVYTLTMRGDAPVVDPTPTPEPANFSYTAVPLLGFFLARRRAARASLPTSREKPGNLAPAF